MRRATLVLAILILCAVPLLAQEDAEGCNDHPLFNRLTGFYISNCDSSQFDLRRFPKGALVDTPEGKRAAVVDVEGPVWKVDYQLREGAVKPSPLQIMRNFQNAAKRAVAVARNEIDGWRFEVDRRQIGEHGQDPSDFQRRIIPVVEEELYFGLVRRGDVHAKIGRLHPVPHYPAQRRATEFHGRRLEAGEPRFRHSRRPEYVPTCHVEFERDDRQAGSREPHTVAAASRFARQHIEREV